MTRVLVKLSVFVHVCARARARSHVHLCVRLQTSKLSVEFFLPEEEVVCGIDLLDQMYIIVEGIVVRSTACWTRCTSSSKA